jgi:hypothetical protein
VSLPKKLEELFTKNFCTPDWESVFEQFPEWRKSNPNFTFQEYFLFVCRELTERNIRSGRTEDEWGKRYFEHWGFQHFARMIELYNKTSCDGHVNNIGHCPKAAEEYFESISGEDDQEIQGHALCGGCHDALFPDKGVQTIVGELT